MTNEEIIKIVDHKRRGGLIEECDPDNCNWFLFRDDDDFNFKDFKYRVQPGQKAIINHYNASGIVDAKNKDMGGWSETFTKPGEWLWDRNEYRIRTQDNMEKPKEPEKIELPELLLVKASNIYDTTSTLNQVIKYLKQNGTPSS